MTDHRYIDTGDGLPRWSNPISHAVVAGDMCFVSGQLSVAQDGTYVAGTVTAEARRAFANFFAALEAADFERDDVVFIDIAFADLSELSVVNDVFCDVFPVDRRPARTVYEAAALPFGGKVKITGTAVRRNRRA